MCAGKHQRDPLANAQGLSGWRPALSPGNRETARTPPEALVRHDPARRRREQKTGRPGSEPGRPFLLAKNAFL